jgi:hypothetical protein
MKKETLKFIKENNIINYSFDENDNLTVRTSLYLRNTSIASLPDNLTVGGNLYLMNTSITSLPDNLTVGGSLDLENTSITNKENYKQLSENHVFIGKTQKINF